MTTQQVSLKRNINLRIPGENFITGKTKKADSSLSHDKGTDVLLEVIGNPDSQLKNYGGSKHRGRKDIGKQEEITWGC